MGNTSSTLTGKSVGRVLMWTIAAKDSILMILPTTAFPVPIHVPHVQAPVRIDVIRVWPLSI